VFLDQTIAKSLEKTGVRQHRHETQPKDARFLTKHQSPNLGYYTFNTHDLAVIRRRRGDHNRSVIAKKPDPVCEAGRRSGAWVKVKLTQQQEFVIGGYTPPEGSRKCFGRFACRIQQSGWASFRG
jgi:ATP-dependent DNA ligase